MALARRVQLESMGEYGEGVGYQVRVRLRVHGSSATRRAARAGASACPRHALEHALEHTAYKAVRVRVRVHALGYQVRFEGRR